MSVTLSDMKQIVLIMAVVVLVGCGKKPAEGSFAETKAKAEAGYADAQSNLGFMYHQGQGVEQDFKEALKWCRKSAEQGNACGQNELGTMYARGEGVPRDDKEAVKWYRKAAEQGYAHAQTNLGYVYESGILKDDKEAVKWFRKAAEQGDEMAQNGLAFMYENGRGVEKDVVRAYAWHEIATSGEMFTKLFKEDKSKLAKKMTPEQIAEAGELVKEMIKKNPKLLNKK